MVKDRLYWEGIVKRFWNKVDIKDDEQCWIWTGNIGSHGYGMVYDGHKTIPTHNMSWKITHGDIPRYDNNYRKLLIRHICGNKLCVNPSHLSIGTFSDNANDVHRDGTRTVLNIDDIKNIKQLRSTGMTYSDIGDIFKTTGTTIRRAILGRGEYYRNINNMIEYLDRLNFEQSIKSTEID